MTEVRRDRRLAWFAVIAGLLTLIVASRFGARPMAYCQGIGEALPNAALHAFQMARSPEMLNTALGCTDRVALLNAMNRLDLAAFIPAYAAFLLFATAVLARGALRKLAFLVVGAGIIADVIETATQLWIGARWPELSPAMLPLLTLGSTVKFGALGLGTALLGLALWQRRGIGRIIGLVMIACGLVSLLLLAGIDGAEAALAPAWLALLLALLVNAIRRPPYPPASAGA